MSDETPKKPSERIKAISDATRALAQKEIIAVIVAKLGRTPTEAELASFNATPDEIELDVMMDLSCLVSAVVFELDREAERRSAWEAKVTQELAMLDNFRLTAISAVPELSRLVTVTLASALRTTEGPVKP